MATNSAIEILRRTVCSIAIAAYAIWLWFATLMFLGYAFHPLAERHWPLFISITILLRWIPAVIFFWLWHRPIYVSPRRRGYGVVLAVASISVSYFLTCFATDGLSRFAHGFIEGTIDLWPAIVMLLTVKSRSAGSANSLRNVDTPIA